MTPIEQEAVDAAMEALAAIDDAIDAYQLAGFGSHVTAPLKSALVSVLYAIREVTG
jgi:hypothetical protein